MNKLFVLSGASGSGKSSLLLKIVEEGLCELAPKYSNRKKRDAEDDIIYIDDLKNHSCDVVYERYNNIYGINTSEIEERLRKKNQIVVISDIDSIKKIRNRFANGISVIFVYLQDFCIDNLLKGRYKLNLDDEEITALGSHILESCKTKNSQGFISLDKGIRHKIRNSFSNDSIFQEFVKRYESWIKIDKDYEENKELFTAFIQGKTVDELFKRFCEIISKDEK
jgi:hypothetical protein